MKIQHYFSDRQKRLAIIFVAVLIAVSSILGIAVRAGATTVAVPLPTMPLPAGITGEWAAAPDTPRSQRKPLEALLKGRHELTKTTK